jgi:hypothetical protein
LNFVKCPFCSGHETVSEELAAALSLVLASPPFSTYGEGALKTEVANIRNHMLNLGEREAEQPIEDYAPAICPTPDKRRYAREEYTAHDAAKWMRYAYLCECGYWHLSKTPANMSGPEKAKAPAALGDEFETIDPLMQ